MQWLFPLLRQSPNTRCLFLIPAQPVRLKCVLDILLITTEGTDLKPQYFLMRVLSRWSLLPQRPFTRLTPYELPGIEATAMDELCTTAFGVSLRPMPHAWHTLYQCQNTDTFFNTLYHIFLFFYYVYTHVKYFYIFKYLYTSSCLISASGCQFTLAVNKNPMKFPIHRTPVYFRGKLLCFFFKELINTFFCALLCPG